jgi:hypothetical protein
MKPEDKDKLNKCLEILDTTDLGLSLVWLWTWSTINNILEDETYKAKVTKDDMWDHLCEAVGAGMGFSLEYGAEQHHEDVQDWMLSRDYIVDTMFEDDEDEDLTDYDGNEIIEQTNLEETQNA